MRVATRALLLLTGVVSATSACRQSPPERNAAVENGASATTEIEALPPDESVATPTDELANGSGDAANASQPANAF